MAATYCPDCGEEEVKLDGFMFCRRVAAMLGREPKKDDGKRYFSGCGHN